MLHGIVRYKQICALIMCICFCIFHTSYAAYLKNVPITLTQPDGTVIECFATGDEYYNWVHDKDGYTIVQNPTTGYYCYAELNDASELVASTYIVGRINPQNTSLRPYVNIPIEKIVAQCEGVMQSMQKSTSMARIGSSSNFTKGTINNIVVYIRFADQTEFPANQGGYTSLFNSETGNSMKNYFRQTSYNKLTINSSFYPTNNGSSIVSYQDSYQRAYYCPYNAYDNTIGYRNYDERIEREHSLLSRAINYVKSQIPTSLNIDHDNDGYVDDICFIVRGGTTPWNTILWPHRWSLYSKTETINGKRVYDYNFQIEESLGISNNGVLCHEMGHVLGAPDLYQNGDDGTIWNPVGSWDVMARHINPPQSMGAFIKHKYTKWIDEIPSITVPGIYTLNPISKSSNNCYKIPLAGTSEYLVLEYRKKEGDFESSLERSGLLIYRINEAYRGNNSGNGYGGVNDEVYIFRPDGTLSTVGKIWEANFTNAYRRTRFNKTTNPNCFMSDGSVKDIYIKNITENSDGSLSFGFSYCGEDDRVFSNTSSLPSNTNVSGSIQTNNSVVVKSTDNVTFQATDYIELGPGFEVTSGGTFNAKVSSCR